MKPDWDRLMGDFKGHATAVVADVDCTAEGKPLCDSNGVQGFPTIKHGDPSALEDYEGGRSYDDLKKFADENLKPNCSPSNIDLCDDDKKAEIEKLQAMDGAELKKLIKEKEDGIAAAEKSFEKSVKKLQRKYERLQKKKEAAIAEIKESGLGLMKAVAANAGKAASDKEEL
jgi:hypothetical protein